MFERVFVALDDAHIRFVVVGGVAVVLHGHPRLTLDLDLAIDLDSEFVAAAIDGLVALGLRPRLPVDPRDFADAATRQEWISERNMRVFSLRDPEDVIPEVDLFAESPMPFDDLFARSVSMQLDNSRVHVASIDDLIAMKRDAGRAQDLADIEALQGIIEGNDEP